MISKQRIIIGADIFKYHPPGNRFIEHSTQRRVLDITGVHTKANESPDELLTHPHHPVGIQPDGFTSKQVDAPGVVLHVSDKG
jgi:hypothetical protein